MHCSFIMNIFWICSYKIQEMCKLSSWNHNIHYTYSVHAYLFHSWYYAQRIQIQKWVASSFLQLLHFLVPFFIGSLLQIQKCRSIKMLPRPEWCEKLRQRKLNIALMCATDGISYPLAIFQSKMWLKLPTSILTLVCNTRHNTTCRRYIK